MMLQRAIVHPGVVARNAFYQRILFPAIATDLGLGYECESRGKIDSVLVGTENGAPAHAFIEIEHNWPEVETSEIPKLFSHQVPLRVLVLTDKYDEKYGVRAKRKKMDELLDRSISDCSQTSDKVRVGDIFGVIIGQWYPLDPAKRYIEGSLSFYARTYDHDGNLIEDSHRIYEARFGGLYDWENEGVPYSRLSLQTRWSRREREST